jgi:hypothetical protein
MNDVQHGKDRHRDGDDSAAAHCRGLAGLDPCEDVSAAEESGSHMLIDEDRVSIRIHGDEAGRPRCALVALCLQPHSVGLRPALQVADVGELGRARSHDCHAWGSRRRQVHAVVRQLMPE